MESWSAQTRAWAVRLTRFLSQTDTPGERDFAAYLADCLAQTPYFCEHPGQIRLERTVNDPHERYVLLAVVRGTGRRALILTGHYDVVGIENYGGLAEWACDPDALLPRLVALLQDEAAARLGLPPADQLALDDLSGGDFLPGRGLLDMKSGLAAGLAVLERYSQLSLAERPGSLVLVAVPDEEIASNGARTAGALLPGLGRAWGLEFEAAINLDASDDHGDGRQGQSVYLGSVGKLLPAVYLVGRETHAGSPFSGVNANLLAAELTRRIESNPSLSDQSGGVCSAPPTCLKQADTKAHYDVTTPTSAWCYYNWLTLQRPVGSVLTALCDLARQALAVAVASVQEAAGRFGEISGQALLAPDWCPHVRTYAEVKALALERGGAGFQARLEALEKQLAADPALDTPTCCLRLTEATWLGSGLSGPAAVVGFAAIYYPPVASDSAPGRPARLRQVILQQAEAVSREAQTPISVRPFFPGISDISFLGGRVNPDDLELLKSNTPAWQSRAGFDFAGLAGLDLPAVNIGPWGRDYHQRLERVYTPYSFQTLPELLWRITGALLGEGGE